MQFLPPRAEVRGKFLYLGVKRFRIQGVTYGPFRPDELGCEYGSRERVERDFEEMRAAGINTVRTYTVPPRWFLDAAKQNDLFVFVGLAWEQHITFLDQPEVCRRIEKGVREAVRSCSDHPAVLCYGIGNEIPAPIVRWHGHEKIEAFLARLARIVRAEDPRALLTYVSYPTTEYLELPFLDFIAFNVFLEEREKLARYLARLQNIAGDLPLILTEIGLDSLRNGEQGQADTLAWMIQTVFEAGCAGACVFSWTDEWFRGGHDILDWNFGLVDRAGKAKPAFESVRQSYTQSLLRYDVQPLISVVICSYNGASTIRECLDAVTRLDYERYEVIVVNDGSKDSTPDIAREFDVRLINIENGGLSNARNLGMRAARGEIVAYIDDDAYPDPGWLTYLAITFQSSSHVGVGGPNLPPPDDGDVSECVANAPGGPSHVLFTDTEAEHLPGCNMAFRREAILAIDGFDTQFTIAGDDVDLCWRLQDQGGTLGFNPCAIVWHHRRGRVRDYLRQQRNYGRAEGMLEAKWPERYNRLGHMRWAGRLYGKGHTPSIAPNAKVVDHGVWGTRLFQSMYMASPGTLWSLTTMPEWHLVIAAMALFSVSGFGWAPIWLLSLPLLGLAIAVPLVQATLGASQAQFQNPLGRWHRMRLRALTWLLHILQPMVRLQGRIQAGLTPWRMHGRISFMPPRARLIEHWSEQWRSQAQWMEHLEMRLRKHRVLVRRGGNLDRWDLQADCGLLGGLHLLSTIEEHGGGRQMLKIRLEPRVSWAAWAGFTILLALTAAAWIGDARLATWVYGAFTAVWFLRTWRECSSSIRSVRAEVRDWQGGE